MTVISNQIDRQSNSVHHQNDRFITKLTDIYDQNNRDGHEEIYQKAR